MKILLALLGMWCMSATALEARDTRGLSLSVERIPEGITVDGLAMQIHSATGRDVAGLAARIEARWRAEGSVVQSAQSRWQMLSRFEHGRSELIQWRGEGPSAQLLHSIVDTTHPTARPAREPFTLPLHCAWGRFIEGRAGHDAFEQRTGRCSALSGTVFAAVQRSLVAQGWDVSRASGTTLELTRDGIEGRLFITQGAGNAATAVVWIARRAVGRKHP